MPLRVWLPGSDRPPPPPPTVHNSLGYHPQQRVQPVDPPPPSSPDLTYSEAFKEEEERRKRVGDRHTAYIAASCGNLLTINKAIYCEVLDFDPRSENELVVIHEHFVRTLKFHQLEGVKFLWDACFESIERIKANQGSGCILAHCMGLGKSLQVVTLVHTVLTNTACQECKVCSLIIKLCCRQNK